MCLNSFKVFFQVSDDLLIISSGLSLNGAEFIANRKFLQKLAPSVATKTPEEFLNFSIPLRAHSVATILMPNPGLRKNSNESKASETRISITLTFRQLRQKIGKKPSAESFASLLRNRPPGSDCLMQMRRLAKPPHKFQSGTFLSFFLPSISCGVKGLPTNSTKA